MKTTFETREKEITNAIEKLKDTEASPDILLNVVRDLWFEIQCLYSIVGMLENQLNTLDNPMERTCNVCGKINKVDFAYCSGCGFSLSPDMEGE